MKLLFLIGDKLEKKGFGKDIIVKEYSTVKEAFEEIRRDRMECRFKLIYVVIYIDLFEEFCEIYSKESDFLLASIIFSDNVYDNINKKYINDLFYNPGGITDNYEYIKNILTVFKTINFMKHKKEI